MSLKRFAIILGVVVVGLWTLSTCNKGLSGVFSSAATARSAFAFDAREVERRLARVDAALPGIERAVAEGDHRGARRQIDDALYELRRSRDAVADLDLGNGRKLGGEIARREALVAAAARREFDRMLVAIEKGDPDTAPIRSLIESLSGVGGSDLRKLYDAEAGRLDRIRARLAARWIRVHVGQKDDVFGEVAMDRLDERVVLPPGFRLAHGPALGPREAAATFALLDVSILTNTHYYEKEGPTPEAKTEAGYRKYGDVVGGLIERLTLRLTLTKTKEFRCSWDDARSDARVERQIELVIETPKRVDRVRGKSLAQTLAAMNRQRIEELTTRARQGLAELPRCEFAKPGPQTAQLSRENALYDKAGFIVAAREALEKGVGDGLAARIAVELEIEELGAAVEARFPKMAAAAQSEAVRALCARPWFDEYRTVRAVIATAPDVSLGPLVDALKGDFDQAAVRQEMTRRIFKGEFGPSKGQALLVLVSNSPAAAMPEFAALFENAPAAARKEILSGMLQADRARAAKFALQLLEARNAPAVVAQGFGSGISRLHSGQVPVLSEDERKIFLGALARSGGQERLAVIEALPGNKELFLAVLQGDRAGWKPLENLKLFEKAVLPLHYDARDYGAILGEIFAIMKADNKSDPAVARQAQFVANSYANSLFLYGCPEQTSIPLILEVIDLRSPPYGAAAAGAIGQLSRKLTAGQVLAHPDGRGLLAKCKQHPDKGVREVYHRLIAAAAREDPSFREP